MSNRKYILKFIGILFLWILSTDLFAYDFEVNGVYYYITSSVNREVAVGPKIDEEFPAASYSGNITIPQNVSYLGETYTVTSIKAYTFYNCSTLKTVSMPNSIKEIGRSAFLYCNNLNSVKLSENIKSLPTTLFMNCENLLSISIPSSVSEIGESVFSECSSLSEVVIPPLVTSIPSGAFAWCTNLKTINIPSSVSIIKPSSFYGCSSLKELHLSNVTSIGNSAFWRCSSLSKVLLPNTMTSIDAYAFAECKNLRDVISEIKNPFTLGVAAFQLIPSDAVLTVPKGSLSSYQASKWAAYFNNIVEAEDSKNYYLSITALGSGSITYNGSAIRNKTTSFSVNEGTSATVTFSPDSGYRIASVKVNNTDVTSSVSNNQYIISNITANTTLSVTFEAIPQSAYTLSITVSGNGSVSYNNTTFKNQTKSFSINLGESATISVSPDNGYRIKSMFVNGSDITSDISNNSFTINYINRNITVEVTFEANPITTYTLSVTSSGNGSASYNGTAIRNKTTSFSVNGGASATVSFSPDSGYRIASVKVNNTDVTSSVSNNQYTISNITANTTLSVTFEAIPQSAYTLSITASGNGSVSYNSNTFRNQTKSFSINLGESATISVSPDNGYRIKSMFVNGSDITSDISNNSFTINYINRSITVEVTFETNPITTYTLSVTSSGNGSASYNGTAIRNKTTSFSVNGGTSATVTFSPDSGYRIASVKVNNTDVTSSVSNNQYTISNITASTTLAVTFETIPQSAYTLSITVSGNGSVSYNSNTFRNQTKSFSINLGESATISVSPDNGYRIKSLYVNGSDITSYTSAYSFTINNITSNTTVEVVFEVIPQSTYTLSITASGNGSASFNNTTIRNNTEDFTLNEGSSATISFNPDNGYRIKSVKVNNTDVTSSVSNNQYTISNITANTKLEVAFEAIPATTYSLSIKVTGNGTATYNNTTIRNKSTHTFTINEGTTVSITLTPDNGYRIKSVLENSTNVTSYVSNGKYTINHISRSTKVEVEFEEITPTTYMLSIQASGNGSVTYGSTDIKNQTMSFTVEEGSSATLTFSPESNYRIKSVKVNNSDVTSSVSNNKYTISDINQNTTVVVEFEAIPISTYTLSITASGNGYASYSGTTVRDKTTSFTINKGTSATITFSPDNGSSLRSVKVNNTDVTSQVTNNRYTINNITANKTLTVTFQEDVNALTVDGVNYAVVSQASKTVRVTGGDYGQVLNVPATVTSNGTKWTVTGIETNAVKDITELAAIIWEPAYDFTATVSNPNLLLYVKASRYAPTSIQNVVVNGTASNIILQEATYGNSFYCPQSFVAQKISFTHNYKMQTGIDESRGWETLALPFDVQTITHIYKGSIKPFNQWQHGDTSKPFWLYELTGSGFVATNSIKAYTPYIISLPNHQRYDEQWRLNGRVTFEASSVTIGKTDDIKTVYYKDRTFVPCFVDKQADAGIYALNVTNDFHTNESGMTEGSKFVLNMRKVHPFEAYLTSASAAPYFDVFEEMTTGIQEIYEMHDEQKSVKVYNLKGQLLKTIEGKTMTEARKMLPSGVYIVNGQKMIIK